jgi:hypothetical protein
MTKDSKDIIDKAKRDHDYFVKPFDEERANVVKISLEFEKIALQTSITLNSTLIFAAPTFSALIDRSKVLQYSALPMLFFSIGLLFSLVTLIYIRRSLSRAVGYWTVIRDYWEHDISLEIARKEDSNYERFGNMTRYSHEHKLVGERFADIAEYFGIFSYLMLICGALTFVYSKCRKH